MSEAAYKIYPNVQLGKNVKIEDFVVLGVPPQGKKEGELPTIIGDNAHIRSHTVIYAGNKIGNNFITGHSVLVRECNEIGDNVSIGSHSVIEHHIKMQDKVRVHSQAFVCEYSILEEGSWVGPDVVFTNVYHPLCPKAKECIKGPILKKGAKIGANATLLPTIVVGENALIGSGSVVTKDVAAGKVVAGTPARKIKEVKDLTCPFALIERPY